MTSPSTSVPSLSYFECDTAYSSSSSRRRMKVRETLFAALSFALGAWAFYKTQQVAGPGMESILNVCTTTTSSSITNNNSTAIIIAESDLHPFEAKAGLVIFTPFVCLMTQFLYQLTQSSTAGFLVWFGNLAAMQPVSVLMTVEAGRGGTRGPVRYPSIVFLLFQLLGISVVFPTVWIPAYCFGRSDQAVSTTRAQVSVPLAFPVIILSILVFWLDTNSYAWQVCSGILSSPMLALLPALLYGLPAPKDGSRDIIKKGTEATCKAYLRSSIIAFSIWWFILHKVWSSYYGYGRGGMIADSTSSLWKDLWTEANPAVAFMTIDCLVLWASMLLFIGYHNTTDAVTALLLTPLLGPGASCCVVMAEIESDKLSSGTPKSKQE